MIVANEQGLLAGRLKGRTSTSAPSSISTDPASGGLRYMLFILDAATAWVSWVLALIVAWPGSLSAAVMWAIPMASAMALCTVILANSQHLYQSRVCALKAEEVTRLTRVACIEGLAIFAVGELVGAYVSPARAALGGTAVLVALSSSRSGYSAWLRSKRARGHFARPICILGTDREAQEIVHLVQDHPELGYRVVGVIGDPSQWEDRGMQVPAYDRSDPVAAVMAAGGIGAIVTTGAIGGEGGDYLVTRLMSAGFHVQLSTGLTRVGHHRVRAAPVGHHLTFYVEPHRLTAWQSALKRLLDLTVGALLLGLSAPVVGVAAILIKLHDGGSVLYRQERVGLKGQTFSLLKLRTMVPDASQRLEEMRVLNQREGPLFKAADDPRITRVGRFLRTCSIDELPQLLNVMRGQMSMVGPRPALPEEFAQFDEDLMDRAQVLPGITGLWQVEARDNPSFRTYRRLDLFYVDNWSVAFDLAIMAGTARLLSARIARSTWRLLFHRNSVPEIGSDRAQGTLRLGAQARGIDQ